MDIDKLQAWLSKKLIPIAIFIMAAMTLWVTAPLILESAGVFRSSARSGVIGSTMVDHTLPAGFLEQDAVNFGQYIFVWMTPGAQMPDVREFQAIALVALPPGTILFEETAREALIAGFLDLTGAAEALDYVAVGSATLRGESIRLYQYENRVRNELSVRVLFTEAFEGKSIPVTVLFAGPVATWDRGLVTEFLAEVE